MKKILVLLMALALAITAAAVPALAEETGGGTDQITSATPPAGGNGRDRQQKQGRDGRDGQLPQAPGQGSRDGRDQAPGKGGRNNRQGGSRAGKSGKNGFFDRLLKNGVISQEVYDAIMAYMKQSVPQEPAGGASHGSAVPPAQPEGTEPPALPEGTEPPAQPEGTEPPAAPDGAPEDPAGMEEQLLKDLLENGVITQEQYDLMKSWITSPGTDASAS